ncbi:DUF58 domain-containing protein [Verrucomicrobium sp. BvORR034]|uniref:DUF58 domain-containing protein n=1 Tax=Verrucomicrobium sp. BvORR034 TaxID=1396418 RepID=UPI002240E8D8|nr:DUF58 domain-containing protein [Verrucomicrobium sp. BvORR034]
MKHSSSSKYLSAEDARALRAMAFAPRMLVEGHHSGKHRSRWRGASMEFHEFRPYTPGDAPHLVDWRVFARTDRFYLKTFEQETRLECHLFVDSSASMGFPEEPGAMTKLDWASHLAACLAYLVTLRQDRVSLTLFDATIRQHLPPGATRGHLQQILHALEQNAPGQKTSLSAALERALPLLKHKATLVVVSDFLDDPAAVFRALGAYLHRGFRVFLFQVLTPQELLLPDTAYRRYVDMETATALPVHPSAVRAAYQRELEEHHRRLSQLSARRGVEFVQARTDQPWLDHLRRLTR